MALKVVQFKVFKSDGLQIYLNNALFCISMGNYVWSCTRNRTHQLLCLWNLYSCPLPQI